MTGETPPSEEIEAKPRFWYMPTVAPVGGDWPQLIKNQWIGTRLPVKSEECILPPKALLPTDPNESVVITVVGFVKVDVQDAVSALRLDGKEKAANFWATTAKSLNWDEHENLYFRLSEGDLIDFETERQVEIAIIPFQDKELGPPEEQLDLDIE